MIEPLGSRLTAQSGPPVSVPTGQPGEKVVDRPAHKVLPAERVPSNGPTGPRPAFQHTYLEQIAALWPEEPEPPVTVIDYEGEHHENAPEPQATPEARTPEAKAPEHRLAHLRVEDPAPQPTVDIRR